MGVSFPHKLQCSPFPPEGEMVKQCKRTPFMGVGRQEPLLGDLSDWWSRRMSHENWMVYRVTGPVEHQSLEIAQLRFHY